MKLLVCTTASRNGVSLAAMCKYSSNVRVCLYGQTNDNSEHLTAKNVIGIMESVAPLIEHPDPTFFAAVEKDLEELIYNIALISPVAPRLLPFQPYPFKSRVHYNDQSLANAASLVGHRCCCEVPRYVRTEADEPPRTSTWHRRSVPDLPRQVPSDLHKARTADPFPSAQCWPSALLSRPHLPILRRHSYQCVSTAVCQRLLHLLLISLAACVFL